MGGSWGWEHMRNLGVMMVGYRSKGRVLSGWLWTALVVGALAPGCALARPPPLPSERAGVVVLPAAPGAHWVWVDDIAFLNMPDGRATLIDGDTGKMLGMLSTGYGFDSVVVPKSASVIYSPESYYSLGTRGTRTDVVTVYDARHLAPVDEIALPPKRAIIMPTRSAAALTDDDRFLLIYDFTPAQSVTVVDTRTRRFVADIGTPGCALVYPTGPRSFFSICSNGALLQVKLNDHGAAAAITRTPQLFNPQKDPLEQQGVRFGNTWLFTSFHGWVYPMEHTARGERRGRRWSLFTAAERARHWRTGGLQYLAIYRPADELYVIVHRGDVATRKAPGTQVWVYNIATHRRVQRIRLRDAAGSILVTQDKDPLLFTCFIGSRALEVYQARTGRYLRTVADVAETPTTMVSP